MKAVGLDIGAVDVRIQSSSQKIPAYIICEVNSAPALGDQGIEVYKNVITKFVPYEEVPSYLSAADIAFIWRDKSIVNKVASPVKVSEYIACGLPVVHNGTVDLINEVTIDKKDALRIDSIDNLNLSILSGIVSNLNRQELAEKGRQMFGLATLAASYKKIYSRVK